MTISNFQLIAINQTLAGASLTPPNITVNMAAYSNVAAVSSYSNAYIFGNVAYTNGNITLSNWANLQALGSNSFPQFFGTTPFVYSSNLNTGPLFLKISTRISNLFPTSKDLSVPIQTINSAYLYARQKSELISAAATASFGSENSPLYFSTGGLVAFGGANATPASMQTVGSVIAQLGDLIDFQRINASFSLAGIVSQIIQSGQMQIGNLHINFFNKVITDPITGQPLFVTPALINQMLNQPTQLLSNQNTYPMVANHRYEAPLRALIDEA